MSAKRNRKQTAGIPDVWALCGLYALLLILFFVPGMIIESRPISAYTLSQATELYQYGNFPGSMVSAREMITMPLLSAAGIALTLCFRNSSGKYAFGACLSALMFGMIGVFSKKYLPGVGGFVIGMAMFVCIAIFFVSLICAIVRRSN